MAIVVVLAAVAMPSFAKQLETSRETADLETIRNAYVDAFADAMKDIQADGALKEGGEYPVSGLKFVQQAAGFQYINAKVAGTSVTGDTISTQTGVTFTFEISESDGGLTLETVETGNSSGNGQQQQDPVTP